MKVMCNLNPFEDFPFKAMVWHESLAKLSKFFPFFFSKQKKFLKIKNFANFWALLYKTI